MGDMAKRAFCTFTNTGASLPLFTRAATASAIAFFSSSEKVSWNTTALAPFSTAAAIKLLPVVCVPGSAKKSELPLTSRLSNTSDSISAFSAVDLSAAVIPSMPTSVFSKESSTERSDFFIGAQCTPYMVNFQCFYFSVLCHTPSQFCGGVAISERHFSAYLLHGGSLSACDSNSSSACTKSPL